MKPIIFPAIKFVLLAVASWLLVHLFTVFGVFLAFAFILRSFFFPEKTNCLICALKTEGERCPFCNKIVDKKDLRPKTFRSILLNFFLILFLTGLSVVLTFVESKLLFKMGFPPIPKTAYFVIPSQKQYRLEEIFPMKIAIVGIKKPINAVQADIGFEPEKLEAVSVSEEESFAKVFIQKDINNQVGYVRLTGGLSDPGYNQETGTFGTVYFLAKTPGVTTVRFLPSSLVMANDGRGTNILKEYGLISYLILPEKVSEEEKTSQEEAILAPVVLGEETEGAKVKLYEENKILGSELNKPVTKNKQNDFFSVLLNFWERYNRFVLTAWAGVLGKK